MTADSSSDGRKQKMFGFRTPIKGTPSNVEQNLPPCHLGGNLGETSQVGEKRTTEATKVRRSIGEFEARAKVQTPLMGTSDQPKPAEKTKPRLSPTTTEPKTGASKGKVMGDGSAEKTLKQGTKYDSRTLEAKACLMKAKLQMKNSRNLKTEIKTDVIEAVDRLFKLVKDAEEGKPYNGKIKEKEGTQERERVRGNETDKDGTPNKDRKNEVDEKELMKKMEEHGKLLRENKEEMDKLKEVLTRHQAMIDTRMTYASVTAGPPQRRPMEAATLHSVVITSKDENDTGEQVFEHVRKAVNAKEEGVRIDKIRRARDRKVIVGCRTLEEIGKVKDKIRKAGSQLNMEEIQNKDPLIVLLGVLKCNSDEDIVRALKRQNNHLLKDVTGENDRMEVRFRRKARNPLTAHVVVKVSPLIWNILTEAGVVHIDLQRVRVTDQSPLVQCSLCLGYGHGKRFCRELLEACSHCGGPHMKTECADWLAEAPPSCCNCQRAKIERTDHNAFSSDCPVRKKWEALARSTIAYC